MYRSDHFSFINTFSVAGECFGFGNESYSYTWTIKFGAKEQIKLWFERFDLNDHKGSAVEVHEKTPYRMYNRALLGRFTSRNTPICPLVSAMEKLYITVRMQCDKSSRIMQVLYHILSYRIVCSFL